MSSRVHLLQFMQKKGTLSGVVWTVQSKADFNNTWKNTDVLFNIIGAHSPLQFSIHPVDQINIDSPESCRTPIFAINDIMKK